MGPSNLIYLLAGLGIGVASRSLWQTVSSRLENSKASQGDGSEIEACQEKLQQMQLAYQMASEMSKFKEGFLARVSHELRSPINGIIGIHQLIVEGLCDSKEEEREFLKQAHHRSQKLIQFIDEMVLVAKTEHGREKQEIQPIPLASIFGEVYKLTHNQAANKNLPLRVVNPEPHIHVLADQRRLRQVLVHLVDSAIDQMQEGSIRLWAEPEPSAGVVRILLEDSRPASAWSDPVNLLTSSPWTENPDIGQPSFGLTLMADKILLELMQSSLEVLAVPDRQSDVSRIQCSLPLASIELQ
ncbi:MAG: histidine kinase dimerization/phospho-acceptor domain-containing protein [Hormoscilla sp.]